MIKNYFRSILPTDKFRLTNRQTHRQTDTQADKRTHRQIEEQTNRQTDTDNNANGQMYIHADGQTDIHLNRINTLRTKQSLRITSRRNKPPYLNFIQYR